VGCGVKTVLANLRQELAETDNPETARALRDAIVYMEVKLAKANAIAAMKEASREAGRRTAEAIRDKTP
jgi:hypothetical protein